MATTCVLLELIREKEATFWNLVAATIIGLGGPALSISIYVGSKEYMED